MDQSRLNKFLALHTGMSRREADLAIAQGRVEVQGQPARLGQTIGATDTVTLDRQLVVTKQDFTYIMLNKPVGYVCSRRQQGDSPTIYSLLPTRYHTLKPVGRLDRDSSGLILLTDNGDFTHRMIHPSFRKTKVYHVRLDRLLQPLHQQMISDYGVQLEDGVSRFTVMRIEDESEESHSVATQQEQEVWSMEYEASQHAVRHPGLDTGSSKIDRLDAGSESGMTERDDVTLSAPAAQLTTRPEKGINRSVTVASQMQSHPSLPASGDSAFPAEASQDKLADGDERAPGDGRGERARGKLGWSPSQARTDTPSTYEITMSEGRNRQIRRTFAALGYTVTYLHRTQFGSYSLHGLASGNHTSVNAN